MFKIKNLHLSIDNKKILALGWKPEFNWPESLKKTITWYLDNSLDTKNRSDHYSGERLGKL